jgi:hypothetical protein
LQWQLLHWEVGLLNVVEDFAFLVFTIDFPHNIKYCHVLSEAL